MIFPIMPMENASCFGFTARNNECGPVRVEGELLGLYFKVLDSACWAEEVVSKGSATEDISKVVLVSDILVRDAAVFVTATSYMQPSQEGFHIQEEKEG